MSDLTPCRFCAERIQTEALRCPYCASWTRALGTRGTGGLYRAQPNRRLAGVCAALASFLDVSPTLIRAAFVLGALFHGVAFWLYGLLWFVLPGRVGGLSGLGRFVEGIAQVFGRSAPGLGTLGLAAKPEPTQRRGECPPTNT